MCGTATYIEHRRANASSCAEFENSSSQFNPLQQFRNLPLQPRECSRATRARGVGRGHNAAAPCKSLASQHACQFAVAAPRQRCTAYLHLLAQLRFRLSSMWTACRYISLLCKLSSATGDPSWVMFALISLFHFVISACSPVAHLHTIQLVVQHAQLLDVQALMISCRQGSCQKH